MAFEGITQVAVAFFVMSIPYLIVTTLFLLYCSRSLRRRQHHRDCQCGGTCSRPHSKMRTKTNEILGKVQPPEQFTNTSNNHAANGIDFFDAPGICQQTRFDARRVTADQGYGLFTESRRQPLSAAQYIGFYH